MNPNLVYAKTPLGEEAVRQGTRVVQRNLRMVLLQVDGKLNVTDLSEKIGNPRLVETCLKELEEAGLVVGTIEVASFRDREPSVAPPQGFAESVEPRSVFSAFVPSPTARRNSEVSELSQLTGFSSFGKPIMPAEEPAAPAQPEAAALPPHGAETDRPIRSFGWRRLALAGGAFLALSLAGLLLYPYGQFRPAIEAAAGRLLGTPVKVEGVGLTLWPRPQLKLTRASIGLAGDGKIAEIRIDSPWSLLGSGRHTIAAVELDGVEISARRLLALPMLAAGGAAADGGVAIGRVRVAHLSVGLGPQLVAGGLGGELVLGGDGHLEKAAFETVDRSLLLEARPTSQGLALVVEGRGWQPGSGAPTFPFLQAKGVLQADKLLIQNLDTTFLGGSLRGNWLLDWSRGVAMAGEGSFSRLDGRQVTAAFVPALRLEGDVSGTLRVRSAAFDWGGLWKGVEAVIDGEVAQGVLHGVDPFEAARRGGGHEVRGGSLRFSRLQFSLAATPKQTLGRNINVDAGVAGATGQFVCVPGGRVDGQLSVNFRSSVSSLQMPVQVSGSLPNLVAASRK